MFRRCCGKRGASKKPTPSSGAGDKPPKDVAVELLGGDDSRPASSLLMRENDFRNIDNNSVLVEFQENVRQASQSTETIPAAVAAVSARCADRPQAPHNGRLDTAEHVRSGARCVVNPFDVHCPPLLSI